MKRADDLSRQLALASDRTGALAPHAIERIDQPYRSSHCGMASRPATYHHADAASQGQGRYCNQPTSWSARLAGFSGTAAIFGLVLLAMLFTWRTVYRPTVSTSRSLVVELRPLAAPPDPVRDVAPGPTVVEKQNAPPVPPRDTPPPLFQLPTWPPAQADAPRPVEIVDPGPSMPKTYAPQNAVAPPADRLSSDAQPDWQSLVLAHLQRFRQYAARARAARQQGVVYIRFSMNRAGMVLTSTIIRKSGYFTLDQAALETLRRAQPLTTIPNGKPDIMELSIPVEFFLSR